MRQSAYIFFRRSLASALVAMVPVLATAGQDDRDGDRPNFRELNAQWWQWALSIPVSVNPLLETTTAGPSNCAVGQRGQVWFLGGTFSSGTLSRRCTVPQGVALYFPILNSFQDNSPGVCGQSADTTLTFAQLRANAAAFIDAATNVIATIDSRPIRSVRRVKSIPFASTFPADNVFVQPCASQTPPGNPAGVYSPSADDGYYGYIDYLSPGDHILHFSGQSGDFTLSVTYQLTVVPVSLR